MSDIRQRARCERLLDEVQNQSSRVRPDHVGLIRAVAADAIKDLDALNNLRRRMEIVRSMALGDDGDMTLDDIAKFAKQALKEYGA